MAFTTVLRRAIAYLSQTVNQGNLKLCFRKRNKKGNVEATHLLPRNRNISTSLHSKISIFPTHHHQTSVETTSSEKEVIDIIDSKIKIKESKDTGNENPELLFCIKDTAKEDNILLERKYESETIKIQIERRVLSDGDDAIPMTVTIDKDSNVSLGFEVSASSDYVRILKFFILTRVSENLDNVDKEVKFSNLNEKMRKTLHAYIDNRGIKPSMVKALKSELRDDKETDSKMWLKDLKSFMEI